MKPQDENKHIGSSLDDLLSAEALLDEATAMATKRVSAWQTEEELKEQTLSNSLSK